MKSMSRLFWFGILSFALGVGLLAARPVGEYLEEERGVRNREESVRRNADIERKADAWWALKGMPTEKNQHK